MSEQHLHQLLMQKQQLLAQQNEIEAALKELEGGKTAYKIVGGIMVEKSAEDLKKDLTEKKELIDLRIKSLDKQEEQMRSAEKK